jgi:uncharacterized protein with HXXEE motif
VVLHHAPGRVVRRIEVAFGALVLVQAAHSFEESVGRLWESFPPAMLLTSLISSNHERAFIVLNIALVTFGVWCLLWPIRLGWRSANGIAWGWVIVETINGVGHPAWSALQGRYTPGVATAPFLLVIALYLAAQLRLAGRASLSRSA